MAMDKNRILELAGVEAKKVQILNEVAGDTIQDKAIDWIDDLLAALPEKEQYGEKGDILRFILKRIQ